MPQKQTLKFNGKDVTGESIPFTTNGEQWSEYVLNDGSTMRVKTVMMDVLRLDGEYNEAGDPVYLFTAQNVVSIFSNPELKKKAVEADV